MWGGWNEDDRKSSVCLGKVQHVIFRLADLQLEVINAQGINIENMFLEKNK